MRVTFAVVALIAGLAACSEGSLPVVILGPGPSDPAPNLVDPGGPSQDELAKPGMTPETSSNTGSGGGSGGNATGGAGTGGAGTGGSQ